MANHAHEPTAFGLRPGLREAIWQGSRSILQPPAAAQRGVSYYKMINNIYNEVAVAAIDLLGFSRQVNEDISNALKSIELVREASRKFTFGLVQEFNHFSQTISKPDINPSREFFGDSIFFYGNPEAPIRKQVGVLLILTCHIILTGIVKKQYIARAGIATGNLLIKENKEDKIVIGTAIVNAHGIEINQNWIGGAICFNDYKPPYLEPGNKASLIANYIPPFKEKISENKKIYALNWLNELVLSMANVRNNEITEIEQYLRALKDKQKDQKIKNKYENTLIFIQQILTKQST